MLSHTVIVAGQFANRFHDKQNPVNRYGSARVSTSAGRIGESRAASACARLPTSRAESSLQRKTKNALTRSESCTSRTFTYSTACSKPSNHLFGALVSCHLAPRARRLVDCAATASVDWQSGKSRTRDLHFGMGEHRRSNHAYSLIVAEHSDAYSVCAHATNA